MCSSISFRTASCGERPSPWFEYKSLDGPSDVQVWIFLYLYSPRVRSLFMTMCVGPDHDYFRVVRFQCGRPGSE